jgi:hypothetical protein
MNEEDGSPANSFTAAQVIENYVRIHAFKDQREQLHLIRFFSPYRVPLGMTKDQIRVCLNIIRLKDERDEAETKLALSLIPEELKYQDEEEYAARVTQANAGCRIKPRRFPEELRCLGYMTEERFNAGIVKLLANWP